MGHQGWAAEPVYNNKRRRIGPFVSSWIHISSWSLGVPFLRKKNERVGEEGEEKNKKKNDVRHQGRPPSTHTLVCVPTCA